MRQLPEAQAGPITLWNYPMPASIDAKQVSAAQAGPGMADGQTCVVLYHQTSPSNAAAILRHGRMKLGPGFPMCHGGRGVYLAADPQATSCKANHKGVILECVVSLGRTRMVSTAGPWDSRLRRLWYRYDSIALTFLEGGIEYVVYDPRRVLRVSVHQVLHTSDSCGGISTEGSSSSFRIPADAGCSGGSSGSDAGSSDSGSSVSGDGSECNAAELSASSHAGESRLCDCAGPCQPSCSSCSVDCPPDISAACASGVHEQKQALALESSCTVCRRLPPQQRQQHAPRQQQQRQAEGAACGRLIAEHMLVLLADAPAASCSSKHMVASSAGNTHQQLLRV